MFRRSTRPATDDDALRAQMLTSPPAWRAGDVSAELVLHPMWGGQQTRADVLLSTGTHTARMPLAELTAVADGTAMIAESVHGRDTYFVARPAAAARTSNAEEALAGVTSDQVAFLADGDRRSAALTKLAVLTLSQLVDLVAWGEQSADRERAARR